MGQKALYDKFAPICLSICRRYTSQMAEAEDLMIKSLFKVFDKLDQYKDLGSFEGWIRRITVNECLMEIRKKKLSKLSIEDSVLQIHDHHSIEADLAYNELILLLDTLPTGYRTVFNLYCIEGYKHREIAELLDISINTSKSQLILAKKKMRELIKKKETSAISNSI